MWSTSFLLFYFTTAGAQISEFFYVHVTAGCSSNNHVVFAFKFGRTYSCMYTCTCTVHVQYMYTVQYSSEVR